MKSEEVGFSASLVPLALGGVSPVFVFSVGGKPFVAGDASRLVCLDGSADCDGVDSAGVLDSVLGLAVVKFFCFACSFFFWSLFFLASEGMFKIYVNEFVSDKFLYLFFFLFFSAAVAVTSKDLYYGGAIGEIR